MTSTVQLQEFTPCVVWKTWLPHVNKECMSPVFCLKERTAKFTLKGSLYCHTSRETAEKWTVDLITPTSLGKLGVTVYLGKANGEFQLLRSSITTYSNDKYGCILSFTRIELLNESIMEDKICMVFLIHYDSCPKKTFNNIGFALNPKEIKLEKPSIQPICLQTLSDDMEKIFDEEEHSDVVLKCGDRRFFASKRILSARSEVFAAMFRNKLSEMETGLVNVTDMETSILEQFLRYVYSGKLDSLCMDSVYDLYRAGDKYAIQSLKRKCASFMVDNLSEKNVCQVLNLADTFGDTELLSLAVHFAVNREGFLSSDEWNNFANAHSSLAVKVFQKFHMK